MNISFLKLFRPRFFFSILTNASPYAFKFKVNTPIVRF